MNAHAINMALREFANASGFVIPDPGNGATFALGEGLLWFCSLSASAGGQTRILPLQSDIPNLTTIVLRNAGANAISIADNTGAGAFKSLAADKTLIFIKVGLSDDGETVWNYLEAVAGAGS